jgi:hypothetical protein
MGSVRHGPPVKLAQMIRDSLGLSVAVETGTFQGSGAVALGTLFSDVWSIELSPELAAAARLHHPDPHLHFVQGSSADTLPDVLNGINSPALFWLDGHYSGEGTAGVEYECPILDEVRAIDDWALGDRSVILIDDARLFLGPPPSPYKRKQWPGLMDVSDALRHTHKRYLTVFEDVIIAVPIEAQEAVDDYYSMHMYPHRSPLRIAAGHVKYRLTKLAKGSGEPE